MPFISSLLKGPVEGLQSDDKRRPWPQFNSFRQFVIEEFSRRKQTFPIEISSPFVRMTSCQVDDKIGYAFFTLGLHGYGDKEANIFDVSYGGGKDIVGYGYDLNSRSSTGKMKKKFISSDQLTAGTVPEEFSKSNNPEKNSLVESLQDQRSKIISDLKTVTIGGAHPIPGITNVSITRQGVGTPLIANISFLCFNRNQLEFLRHHFFVVGNHVILEWGNQFSNKSLTKILDFSDYNSIKRQLAEIYVKGRGHIIKEWCKPNNGNYDIFAGSVGNFQIRIDPKTGIYNCNVVLFGVGEQLWGLNSMSTYIKKNVPENSSEINSILTIHDFFSVGSVFDLMVQDQLQPGGNRAWVADAQAKWGKVGTDNNKNTGAASLQKFSTNPQDYQYISWEFFTSKVLPNIFSLITDENMKQELSTFINLYNPKPTSDDQDGGDWIGDNPYLKSISPDTMLLIKKSSGTIPQGFLGIDYFDFDGSNYRGKLIKGVWLNAGMIRECFLTTNTLEQAIQSMLIRLNNATAGFWQLSLFFDEENNQYKIIDNKYTNNLRKTAFYKFNSTKLDASTNQLIPDGELLNVELDSAFPPELITQMALFAKFKTETPPKQDELMEKYPTIGTTSTFIFSLNWTNLKDLLEEEIKNYRKELADKNSSISIKAFAIGTTSDTRDQQQLKTKVSGQDSSLIGAVASLDKNSPSQGQKLISSLFEPKPVGTDIKKEDTFNRSSVTELKEPISNKLKSKINSYDPFIQGAAQRHNVDPNLLKSLIMIESSYNPMATRNVTLSGNVKTRAIGLTQILGTNVPIGMAKTEADLFDPEKNIDASAQMIQDLKNAHPDITIEGIFSAHNGGYRPNLGFGAPATRDVTVTLDRDKITGLPTVRHNTKQGEYSNSEYIAKGMGYYNYFRIQSGQNIATGKVIDAITQVPEATTSTVTEKLIKPSTPTISSANDVQKRLEQQQQDQEKAWQEDIKNRFGNEILKMIETQPSAMVNKLTRHGFVNYPKPNGFVAPYQTTTQISIDILGTSGISVSDGFFVDKIPFIFERYGCFQVTQVNETITESGWLTKITGLFKLMWLNGDGPIPKPISRL